MGFRLLNSEIGNDLTLGTKTLLGTVCFRLLNSEIGNDHKNWEHVSYKTIRFRLLNSEIGNDLSHHRQTFSIRNKFSSP